MPLTKTTLSAGGVNYASPFIAALTAIALRLDVSSMTYSSGNGEVDADGWLKPGVPLNKNGDLIASTALKGAEHKVAVIAGGAAGNHTVTGIATADTLLEVLRLNRVNTPVKHTVISGGAAGDHTVTGITTDDALIAVLHLVGDGTQLDGGNNDLTSEFSITGADTINNTGGTATTNGVLFVLYHDDSAGDTTQDDLTSEFTISAANTINNTGGTATTGDVLIVRYLDASVADEFIWGIVAEPVQLTTNPVDADADLDSLTDIDVAVVTVGIVNRDVIEDNLGRALTSAEVAAFERPGCLIRLMQT